MFNRQALIGLIGANIMKSLAPALHIDAFAAAGITGHYHLMDVDQLPGRSLRELLDAVKTAGFLGVNITFPFKQADHSAARRTLARGAADRRGQYRDHRHEMAIRPDTTPTAAGSV